MPTSLTIEEHGEGIGDAWTVLRDNAARAGLGAAVPTCPGWTVRDLVAHQGMVHRWAAGCLRGERDDEGTAEIEREGLAAPDLLVWLDEGAKDLLATLAFAPADPDIWFFLPDSPGPRQGWARRQCHETTIHAVDAMAAARGATPPAADTWIHAGLAADGVDELLMGFVARRRTGLDLDEPRTVAVRTTDTGQAWTMRVGEGRTTSHVGEPEAGETDVVEISGTAAQVYLALWNRGDEIFCSDPMFLDRWRSDVQVLW
ncbi:MAG: maleylpyruvate isomerase family mycothiol-dependent enzyme [Lapillicoccus sp.]